MKALLIVGLAGGVGLTTTLLLRSGTAEEASDTSREVVLTAQDMRFNALNPTIRLQEGETVDLVVRNSETGRIIHDLTVAGLGVGTSEPLGPGDEARIRFTADRPGAYIYTCTFHNGLMTGKLIVEPR